MFPPSDLAQPKRAAPPAAADLDELWRGIAIILAWALKHYGPHVAERLVAFLVKRCGAVVALPMVVTPDVSQALRPRIVAEQTNLQEFRGAPSMAGGEVGVE